MFISCDFALFLAINLSCVTFNVRGLNNECKRRQVFRWLHGRKFHIIFLQEVYSSRDIEKIWSAEWGGKVVFCHGTKHSCCTLVLFHPSPDVDVEHVEVDKRGREIVLCAKIDDHRFTFINVYAPNDIKTQVEFFESLKLRVRKFAYENIIIGGDLNCCLTPKDKKGGATH